MEKTSKIEFTDKQFEVLSIALRFAVDRFEQRLFSLADSKARDKCFGELQDLYNLQDYIFPETRDVRELSRVSTCSGDPHADL